MGDLRNAFHNDLEEIRRSVARLGASVVELIPRVTQILLDQDLESAEYVILGDAEIDARAGDIENRAISLLALQAPVAGDLRQVATAFKFASEMERSADLCCNICKAARRIHGHGLDPALRGIIQKLGDQARFEYAEAVAAYVDVDDARAAALPDTDDFLDGLHRQFIQQILESHAAGSIDLQVAVQLALAGRYFERLGDHAVNIALRTRFIATGWLPNQDEIALERERHLRDADVAGER